MQIFNNHPFYKDAFAAEKKDIRVVVAHFGVVLGRSGGALQQMITPFKLFTCGPMGNGKQRKGAAPAL